MYSALCLGSVCYDSGSDLGNFATQGHLAMSGDIVGCQNWGSAIASSE